MYLFLLLHCSPQECNFAKIKVIADTTNFGLFVEKRVVLTSYLWVAALAAKTIVSLFFLAETFLGSSPNRYQCQDHTVATFLWKDPILKFKHFQEKNFVVKSFQNKKGLKIFQLPTFRCLFLQLAAEKKHRKVGSWKIFRPFLFWSDFSDLKNFENSRL